MKVIIDIPEKYLKACDALLSLMGEYDPDDKDEEIIFESMKDETIELDLNGMDSKEARELCIGIAMIAVGQKKGED